MGIERPVPLVFVSGLPFCFISSSAAANNDSFGTPSPFCDICPLQQFEPAIANILVDDPKDKTFELQPKHSVLLESLVYRLSALP